MKNYSKITENKDILTMEYADSKYAKINDIPTSTTVSGWGFTKNTGTVTSVAVKMNGSEKGKVTSSGTIDLGTVITSHQDISGKLDKTKYEVNKVIDFGSTGVLYVGRFNVYDTNITCDITSTTSTTYSGKLVIATQNYVITKMTVYGDASNTVAPNFFIRPSSSKSDPYVEIYFKPAAYSKNVVHIYGSSIAAEPTNVCTSISAVPNTATHKPINALTETFQKRLTAGTNINITNSTISAVDTGVTSVEVTGAGNAVTAASYNSTNRKLTLTKGSTFLTSHQDISGLMPKSGGTFTGNVTFPTVPKVGNSPLALKSDIPTIPTLAKVATTGSYTDLSNTPTIPTVNNGTLTIKQNGTTVQTFSANQSGNVTANITVPTFSFSNGVLTITT